MLFSIDLISLSISCDNPEVDMYLVNPLPLGTYIAFFESGLLITSEELADDLDIPANPITAENKNIAKI